MHSPQLVLYFSPTCFGPAKVLNTAFALQTSQCGFPSEYGCHFSFTFTQLRLVPQSLHLLIGFFSKALLLDSLGSGHGTPQPRLSEVREMTLAPEFTSDARFVARLFLQTDRSLGPPARSSHSHPRLPLPVILEPFNSPSFCWLPRIYSASLIYLSVLSTKPPSEFFTTPKAIQVALFSRHE